MGEDVAEDLLHDVFVRIHGRVGSLKEESKLESWLYQITRNAIVDYYRSKRPTEALPTWLEQPQSNEEDDVRLELSRCLGPMIERMPDSYRRAVQLSEIENRTQKDVADLEGISLSGAKSRVQRGRSMLARMLRDCCELELNRNNQVVDFRKRDPGSCEE